VSKKDRFRQPPSAQRPAFSPMMASRRTMTRLLRVEVGMWEPKPDLDRRDEEITVTAVYCDGTRIDRIARVSYAKGEREKVMDGVLDHRKATWETVRIAQSIFARRQKAVDDIRAEFWRTPIREAA
jgi:hypothetical protein